MTPLVHIALAPYTTLRIGGEARYFISVGTENELEDAITFAKQQQLPLLPLGAGSNVLVPDEGIAGVVARILIRSMTAETIGPSVRIIIGAGTPWDDVVDFAIERDLFGIENLAGIPGTAGGAVVQNIGAYGSELKSVFEYADTVNSITGEHKRLARSDAAFGYRDSAFKKSPELVVTQVSLLLTRKGALNVEYGDLAKSFEAGIPLSNPAEVAAAVRAIRAKKFPTRDVGGTAGSFFKNPVVASEQALVLGARFPQLPQFVQPDGRVKLSLAWILDHILALKGYAVGRARLFEKQPLVIVATDGATAADVEVLAHNVEARVLQETGIAIEREVETFGKRFSL
jgi:UDP-N-acetylmuramate dehydrogenase